MLLSFECICWAHNGACLSLIKKYPWCLFTLHLKALQEFSPPSSWLSKCISLCAWHHCSHLNRVKPPGAMPPACQRAIRLVQRGFASVSHAGWLFGQLAVNERPQLSAHTFAPSVLFQQLWCCDEFMMADKPSLTQCTFGSWSLFSWTSASRVKSWLKESIKTHFLTCYLCYLYVLDDLKSDLQ